MDNVAPRTDPIPFTAHIFGMIDERFAFRRSFMPVGKSIPMKNPNGMSRKKDIITLRPNGIHKKWPKSCFKNRASVMAVNPVAMAAMFSLRDGAHVDRASQVHDPIPAPIRRENSRIAAE